MVKTLAFFTFANHLVTLKLKLMRFTFFSAIKAKTYGRSFSEISLKAI